MLFGWTTDFNLVSNVSGVQVFSPHYGTYGVSKQGLVLHQMQLIKYQNFNQ